MVRGKQDHTSNRVSARGHSRKDLCLTGRSSLVSARCLLDAAACRDPYLLTRARLMTSPQSKGVIDLVETGTTMRAAGLEQIGCVMKTQTVLIANKDKVGKPLVQKLNKRILGYVKSMKHSMLAYNVSFRRNLRLGASGQAGKKGREETLSV